MVVSLFFFILPTPSSTPSRGAARVIWLLILWHWIVCICLIFFVMHDILFSLYYAFSARHFPPSRDCGLCHPSISCWFSPFRLSPRHDGGLREGFDVGFPCHSACGFLQFAFLRPPSATLVVHGRLFTVVCLIISPSSSRPSRHAGGTREVFEGGLPYYIKQCLRFLRFLSSRFSWLHSQAIQTCGNAVVLRSLESGFPRISHTSAYAAYQGGLVLWYGLKRSAIKLVRFRIV